MPKKSPSRGFTLVELMVVVAMFCGFAALGASAIAGSSRNQETAGLARAIHMGMLSARSTAVADGFQRRWTCISTGCFRERAATSGMGAAAAWVNDGENVSAGRQGQVWAVDNATDLTPKSLGGPLAGSASVTFFPDGTASASTVFVNDVNNAHRYKVYVFSATGMARMVDQW
jgi:prepilin-type N-terminal cleavage/methylation domain-containing protein